MAKKKSTKKKVAKKTTKKKATKKTAKKKAAKKTAKKAAAKDTLIVASKVKAYIKANNKMTASETLEALNEKLYAMIDGALARTEANRRSTVKPQDL